MAFEQTHKFGNYISKDSDMRLTTVVYRPLWTYLAAREMDFMLRVVADEVVIYSSKYEK